MIGVSEVIAAVGVGVALAIGGIQIWQNRRTKSVMQNDSITEEDDIKARGFISKYYDVQGLIPLCAIAFSYDKCRHYSRDMYNEFLVLSKSVRTRIFELLDWAMCDFDGDDFMGYCMTVLEQAVSVFLPTSHFGMMFNDGGKYVERAILYVGSEHIPDYPFEYYNGISDIICIPFRDHRKDIDVIGQLRACYNFGSCPPINAYYLSCKTAEFIAVYAAEHSSKVDENCDYGAPGSWSGEELETMEDLFLSTLFEIWTSLHDIIEFDTDGGGE